MADFSEFAVPSADWMALEPTLSNPPDIPVLELKQMINKTREASAAQAMIDEGRCTSQSNINPLWLVENGSPFAI